MKRSVTATTALAMLVVAGCGASGSSSSARAVRVDEKLNGRTVHVDRGDLLELRLHSTYWQVDPARGGELAVASRKVVPAAGHCVPGQGCGTVEVNLRAERAGRLTLRAHRASCGEALNCTGSQGVFTVDVVVG